MTEVTRPLDPPPPDPPPPPPDEPPPHGRPPWWRERWWLWLALVALVAVAIVVAAVVTAGDDEEETVAAVVPEVIGLEEADAIERLRAAGYEAELERALSEEPAGIVIAQQPAAGTRFEAGSTVLLTVSEGPPPATTVVETQTETVTATEPGGEVAVPDVTGQPHEDGGRAVDDAGLVADSFPAESGLPRGTIISQDPAAGTEVPLGTHVTLGVALGPGDRPDATVPDVTGPPAEEAREIARQAGFTVRTLERDAPTREEVGEVILQRPAAGTRAPILSQITLYVGV